jgi:hypothetical protein
MEIKTTSSGFKSTDWKQDLSCRACGQGYLVTHLDLAVHIVSSGTPSGSSYQLQWKCEECQTFNPLTKSVFLTKSDYEKRFGDLPIMEADPVIPE